MQFIYCFKSEWLKKKHSLASWLVVIGSFFTPVIITIARSVHYKTIAPLYKTPNFWESLLQSSWESMAIFLLPLGTILATSLITQIEYKNNTWKQLHTTPQRYTTLFFAKLSVIVLMLLQFFLLFNIGIWLSAMIPALVVQGVPFPGEQIPWLYFIKQNGHYFVELLPMIALQYLISLRFKNFLVPVGTGILLLIFSIAVLTWKWGWLVPYTYCAYHYIQIEGKITRYIPIDKMALLYFGIFITIGYVMYLGRKEKG